MECRTLVGVSFGPASRAAIQEIRSRRQAATMLRHIIPAGTMVNIFAGNDALKIAYSIHSTDFEMMARAVAAVSAIEQRVLLQIAELAALDTQGRESQFWRQIARGIAHGCAVAA